MSSLSSLNTLLTLRDQHISMLTDDQLMMLSDYDHDTYLKFYQADDAESQLVSYEEMIDYAETQREILISNHNATGDDFLEIVKQSIIKTPSLINEVQTGNWLRGAWNVARGSPKQTNSSGKFQTKEALVTEIKRLLALNPLA